MSEIVIIDYGAGNIESVKFALNRLGVDPILTADKDRIKAAGKVIFPGVGEAKSAMNELKQKGLDEVIPKLTQPVLGICLGMQLMCRYSEEGNAKGLNIFPLDIKRFNGGSTRKIHMGWNTIRALKGPLFEELNRTDYMYFVHGFYAENSDYASAISTYQQPFSAALQKDNFYAVQFHPEKSGNAGAQLLRSFIQLN
jgi:glutamine amidotransferase